MSNLANILKNECFQIPNKSFQMLVNGSYQKCKLKRRNIIEKTIHRSNAVERVSLELIDFTKKLIRDYPEINILIRTVTHAKGLEKFRYFTKSNDFTQELQEKLHHDPNISNFYQTDLSYIAKLSKDEFKEIDYRLGLFYKQLLKISPSRKFARDHSLEIFNNPETYAKLARAIEFRKIGPKPNHVTNHLKQLGYTDQDLKECMSLAAMSTVCLTQAEYERVQNFRRDCPFPEKAFKVLTNKDYKNYVNGVYDCMIGFWADAAHYEGITTEKMIYDILRLDYPKTEFHANAEKIYAMRFSPKDILEQAQIPFTNRIKTYSNGELSNNTPGNPYTGGGCTATREPILIPEYRATSRHPIPFVEEQTCIGYFDKKGTFHEEYMFYKGVWVDIKQYETRKEIEKLMTVLDQQKANLLSQMPHKDLRDAMDR